MKTLKISKTILIAFAFIVSFTACEKDNNEITEAEPTIENLEIGSGNNKRGLIGRDFHLDMDVTAGSNLGTVGIRIEPMQGETYASPWKFEIFWEEFSGAKNTNVHKHFNIPENAVEGKYAFIVVVNDQNGKTLEHRDTIQIVDPVNLPADPELYSYMAQINKKSYLYILNRGYMDQNVKGYTKGDTVNSFIDIRNVKDDGVLYYVLIKKSANYRPESVNNMDFSKVIVIDRYEHKGMAAVGTFINYGRNRQPAQPDFVIGASSDNNTPESNSISGDKSWENGDYLLGIIYTNTTHNLNTYFYIDCKIDGF